MRQGRSHAPKLPSSRMHSACHAIRAAMNAGVAKDARDAPAGAMGMNPGGGPPAGGAGGMASSSATKLSRRQCVWIDYED